MKLHVHLSSDWILDTEMREYRPSDEVDFCIIGTGAGGGVLAQRLARFGFSVVALEAGPWHDTELDMVSDEAGSGQLFWNDVRITGGTEPLEFGANNSGRGVGGSTIHYAGFCPRLHPSDFRVKSLDGVAADWPMSYADLEPYYAAMEREYPVSGPARYPWGKPHGYPYAPLQAGTAGQKLIEGCVKLGIKVVAGGPVAIPPGDLENGRTASCAASVCWAARWAQRAARWSATFRTRLNTERRSGPGAWRTSCRSMPTVASLASATFGRSTTAGEMEERTARAGRHRGRVRHRVTAPPAELALEPFSHGTGQLQRADWQIPDGPGGAGGLGALSRTDPPVQGTPRLRMHRGVLRDRPAQRFRPRLRLADRRAAADRHGPPDRGGGRDVRRGAAGAHAGLQPLRRDRRAGRNPAGRA